MKKNIFAMKISDFKSLLLIITASFLFLISNMNYVTGQVNQYTNSYQVRNANFPVLNNGSILFPYNNLPFSSILWSTGSNSNIITGLTPGEYYVTITDMVGASYIDTFEVGISYNNYMFPWTQNVDTFCHDIYIPGGDSVMINGIQLFPGDEIGVFYDSLFNWFCGGSIIWDGTPQILTACYDSFAINGLWGSSEFNFLIRSNTYGIDYIAKPVWDLSGNYPDDSLFVVGGSSRLIGLFADSVIYQSAKFSNNYNNYELIYTPVNPIFKLNYTYDHLNYNWNQVTSFYGPDFTLYMFIYALGTCVNFYTFELYDVLFSGYFWPLPNDSLVNVNSNRIRCYLDKVVNYECFINTCGYSTDGYAEVYPLFGIPPFTYFWNTGDTTQIITNIPGNTNYSCTVTDSQQTFEILNFNSGFTKNYPDIDITIVDQTFFSMGFANVEFPYNSSGGYILTWSNGATGTSIENVNAGNYLLTIQYKQGCYFDTLITINYQGINADINYGYTGCQVLGEAYASLDNLYGNPPFIVEWSTGDTTDSISGLLPGLYSVTIMDNNPDTLVIPFEILPPDDLTVTYNYGNSSVLIGNDGYIDLTVSGGAPPYTILWSNNETSEDIYNLTSGVYSFSITDSLGCQIVDSVVIDSTGLYADLNYGYTGCQIFGEAYAFLYNLYGIPPFTFEWSTGNTTDSISGLFPGIYSVTIIDNFPDTLVIPFVIPLPDPLNVTYIYGNVTDQIGNEGFVDLNITGGITPYNIIWSNGQNTEDLTSLSSGIYSFTVTDAFSCQKMDSVEIYNAFTNPIISNEIIISDNCNGDCIGTIELDLSGGYPPLNIIWSNGETNTTISNLCAGDYSVTISDQSISYSSTMPWSFINTPGWQTIIFVNIPSDPFLHLESGDCIGAFYNDSGYFKCAGYQYLNLAPVSFAINPDDSTTVEKDGFSENELIYWKIWKHNEGILMDVIPTYNNGTNYGYYTSNATDVINSFTSLECGMQIMDFSITNDSLIQMSTNACNSFVSPLGNYEWISSGLYYDTLILPSGCNLIYEVDLLINNSTDTLFPDVACDEYVSPSGNYVWNTSGFYYDTLINTVGCDSIIAIDLTINNISDSSFSFTSCNDLLSPSGNYLWTTTGIYNDTIPNYTGCDSLITIDLTINYDSDTVLTEISCGEYISPSGNNVWTASGIYDDVIPNIIGCDSLITIDLTISEISAQIQQVIDTIFASPGGDSYQWVDCNNNFSEIQGENSQSFTPIVSGSYAVIVTQGLCSDTSDCYLFTGSGIENDDIRNINVYPNPVSQQLTISGLTGDEKLIMNDFSGRAISVNLTGEFLDLLDLKRLSPGVYFLKIIRHDQIRLFRIVKI